MSYTSDQISGLDWLYDLRGTFKIAAANLSLGGGYYTTACDGDIRKLAVDNLRSAGIATVIAAGNGASTDAIAAPACISTAISVGATTDSDTPGGADHVAGYSNVSSQIALFAPGSTITSSISRWGLSNEERHLNGGAARGRCLGADEIESAG